ncbi:hypothetical protein ROZALSC1DRAFT_26556 [Rozella allomycis CSF55]|uniref:Uncharacterized protein n=1 Tax=Rozella allomycis (strain CSF55) TaxID=988480 RepID=A0A075B235_ROZAC|nr:hypothetical protein O9G_005438 [Rozella allomycis CSF55]RKP22083.1 hypothetical protein ROZALSC1DRAFT_26556 [Rozella allomycis CSF55]|eukprot:EPZ36440.1 hypothetical protein O9G_005438 [Rozella allomycis CSF55]
MYILANIFAAFTLAIPITNIYSRNNSGDIPMYTPGSSLESAEISQNYAIRNIPSVTSEVPYIGGAKMAFISRCLPGQATYNSSGVAICKQCEKGYKNVLSTTALSQICIPEIYFDPLCYFYDGENNEKGLCKACKPVTSASPGIIPTINMYGRVICKLHEIPFCDSYDVPRADLRSKCKSCKSGSQLGILADQNMTNGCIPNNKVVTGCAGYSDDFKCVGCLDPSAQLINMKCLDPLQLKRQEMVDQLNKLG